MKTLHLFKTDLLDCGGLHAAIEVFSILPAQFPLKLALLNQGQESYLHPFSIHVKTLLTKTQPHNIDAGCTNAASFYWHKKCAKCMHKSQSGRVVVVSSIGQKVRLRMRNAGLTWNFARQLKCSTNMSNLY